MVQRNIYMPAQSIRRLEPHFQQGLFGVLLSGRVISPAQLSLPHNTQHSQEADIYVSGGIQTRNPNKQAAADPRLKVGTHMQRYPVP
jgi:hypothetical protein